ECAAHQVANTPGNTEQPEERQDRDRQADDSQRRARWPRDQVLPGEAPHDRDPPSEKNQGSRGNAGRRQLTTGGAIHSSRKTRAPSPRIHPSRAAVVMGKGGRRLRGSPAGARLAPIAVSRRRSSALSMWMLPLSIGRYREELVGILSA